MNLDVGDPTASIFLWLTIFFVINTHSVHAELTLEEYNIPPHQSPVLYTSIISTSVVSVRAMQFDREKTFPVIYRLLLKIISSARTRHTESIPIRASGKGGQHRGLCHRSPFFLLSEP